MGMIAKKTLRRTAGLSTDAALGAAGCTLAAASAAFGIVMTLHGPVTNLGTSRDFTVFAQLAPRPAPQETTTLAASAKDRLADLDLTATASIPKSSNPKRMALANERAPASSVTLQAASEDAATILVDGRRAIVRVGDTIPGIGEVLAIVPGEAPMLRTTGGVIAMAAAER